jgi:hypothetical protein
MNAECVAFTIVMLLDSVNDGKYVISVSCVVFTIMTLQDSVNNGKDMMSVECVVFTTVMYINECLTTSLL